MLGALARSLFGTANDRIVKGFDKPVAKINALEPELAKLTDEQLRAKTTELRERLAKGETLDDLLVEASPLCARPPNACSASGHSTSSSRAAWSCTRARSPR